MSAQKSILSFFGARSTPPPPVPSSKAPATTPPTITSAGSSHCPSSAGSASTPPPVTPVALGQQFTAPFQTSQANASPGITPPSPPSPASCMFRLPSHLPSTAPPAPTSFFAAFGSKSSSTSHVGISSKVTSVHASSTPLKRAAPSPVPVASAIADDDDDAPMVAICMRPASCDNDDCDLSTPSGSKRPISPSQLAAKFSRYTAGSSPAEPRTPAPPRSMAVARAAGGGSGYGSAKFEATNSERYHWLEDVRDAQGRRLGEPGVLLVLHLRGIH